MAAYTTTTTSVLTQAILTVYSQEVLFAAQPLLRFEQIATRKNELGVLPGKTIQFLRYNPLAVFNTAGGADPEATLGTTLVEGTTMDAKVLGATQLSLSVGERGGAITVSEMLLRTSFDDVLESGARLLGMQMAKARDTEHMFKLYTTGNTLFAGGVADRASLTTNDVFDTNLIRDAVEFLAERKVPKIEGDAYVCFVHPHQAKTIRKDSAWINAADYTQPERILRGEIGRFEDVRFIETTQIMKIATNGAVFVDNVDTSADFGTFNTSTPVYRSLIVGDHCLGFAVALDAELRDNGVLDFGREHQLGWYGIWGMGLIESNHVCILETA